MPPERPCLSQLVTALGGAVLASVLRRGPAERPGLVVLRRSLMANAPGLGSEAISPTAVSAPADAAASLIAWHLSLGASYCRPDHDRPQGPLPRRLPARLNR